MLSITRPITGNSLFLYLLDALRADSFKFTVPCSVGKEPHSLDLKYCMTFGHNSLMKSFHEQKAQTFSPTKICSTLLCAS